MAQETIKLVTVSTLALISGLYIGSKIAKNRNVCVGKLKKNSVYKEKEMEKLAKENNHTDENNSDEEDEEDEEGEEEEHIVEIDSTELNNVPGEVRMALCVRTDIPMLKGKAAAQCCHAAVACYKLMSTNAYESYNPGMLNRWEIGGQAKITLKCPSSDDLDLMFAQAMSLGVNAYVVQDAGRTQVDPGTVTVLGLGPAPRSVLDQITGHLKLY